MTTTRFLNPAPKPMGLHVTRAHVLCVMNLTLSVDRKLVERARKSVAAMGMSLNQAIREYLEQLAGTGSPEDEIEEMRSISLDSGGRSDGRKWDRAALHDRS